MCIKELYTAKQQVKVGCIEMGKPISTVEPEFDIGYHLSTLKDDIDKAFDKFINATKQVKYGSTNWNKRSCVKSLMSRMIAEFRLIGIDSTVEINYYQQL